MHRENRTYSNEFKLQVVQAYLAGEGSMQEIATKYDIRNVSQVKAWLKKFKEVGSIEAFNRLPSTGSGARGMKNPLKGKRTHFKNVEEERDYYKAQVEYLKK
ncbi:transposase [Lysinibacillus sp. NPDC096418]|uniref:transposase n=1 Tax=Lysinibacillus sp. NPDC096418 TaxID=3364138 RepID=UPI0038259E63